MEYNKEEKNNETNIIYQETQDEALDAILIICEDL